MSKKIKDKKKGVRKKKDSGPAVSPLFRGLKVLIHPLFLKTAAMIAGAVIFIAAAGFSYAFIADVMSVRRVVIHGNKYLSEREVILLTELSHRDSLLKIRSRELVTRLLESPWISEVDVRKELPHTIILRIKETKPRALLKRDEDIFIVDKDGRMLEKIEKTVPFLPVIGPVGAAGGEALRAALELSGVLKTGEFFQNDAVEISAETPHDVTLSVGERTIKIGSGNYQEKLLRLRETEREILRRGINVDSIDLRFARRVVVKPVEESGR